MSAHEDAEALRELAIETRWMPADSEKARKWIEARATRIESEAGGRA